MEDKFLNNSYDSFWGYKQKKINVNRSISPKRFPSKKRLAQKGRVPMTVNRRHQTLPVNPYYSEVNVVRRQADYYLAQKRLYQAKAAARAAGYRSPAEKAVKYGKIVGEKTGYGLGQIVGKAKEVSKGSGWKEKIRLLRGKSIYD